MNDAYTSLKRSLQGKIVSDIEHLARSSVAELTDQAAKSQLGQDIFALAFNGHKRNGFFVEFGGTDGVGLSNSYLLEKGFNWQGIVAEPDRSWHAKLRENRSCHIETDCVWRKTGESLEFASVEVGELSTIADFAKSDQFAGARKGASTYDAQTISLIDMLAKYDAPKTIDYLSVDTEGSEYEILSAFDFSAYRFNFVTIEHNYTKARSKLRQLMEANGYQRVFETLSRFDDWYIPAP